MYVLSVLALYVGIIATVVAVIVIGVVCTPVGAVIVVIVVIVWKKFRRSSMYTHTCTLCSFTRCVTYISITLRDNILVSLHVIYKTVCLYLYLYTTYCCVWWTNFSL